MSEEIVRQSREPGPFAYENWRNELAGVPSQSAVEYPLFTDAQLTGNIMDGFGPYQLINTVPDPSTYHSRPALVLRIEYHRTDELDGMLNPKTNIQRYHGGLMQDEIAALTSLCMGIRLKAGTMMRIFEPNADPRGQPVAWDSSEDPMVPRHFQAPVLPQVLGTHSLDKVAPLATLPELTPQDAVDLVRAARFYQDALWMVESTPELSWLMLVSAIEIAAGRWRVNKASPLERLRFSKPDLVAHLEEAGGSALAQEVATEFADSMGVTQNFVDFIIEFLPNPPEIRPPEVFQYPWTREALTRAMKRIYNWRSKALHSGIPFPAPMCRPAHKRHEGGFVERATIGAAMGTRGGVWQDKDAPMALHLFEYITRGCLLKWWESLVPSSY